MSVKAPVNISQAPVPARRRVSPKTAPAAR
jgi:hypothetical protein